MAALERELAVRAAEIDGPVETVYLGGGTPSMLSPAQVRSFLGSVQRELGMTPGAEVTMEAHPDTVSPDSLRGYRSQGVNRLSIGAESLDDAVLTQVGRGHDTARVVRAVSAARAAGFESISLDLMYGLPGQDLKSWRMVLDRLLTLEPGHVSLYPLSIEPGTVFARRGAALPLPPDDLVVEMYHHACAVLRAGGFEHYEVANWARPGRRSLHNLAYWRNVPFAAVGVGAHGYLHGRRYVNMRGVKRYIETVSLGGITTTSEETIDGATRLDDHLMLGLRLLLDGVSLEAVSEEFGDPAAARVRQTAFRLSRYLRIERGRVVLREDAVPVANSVWSEFIGLAGDAASTPDLVSA
jgi:oxygen-independent coproporphyrinogen-3 oxidase